MHLAKAFALIAATSVMGCELACAEGLCPAMPFETDVQIIAATMSAEPLKPMAWYAEAAIAGGLDVTEGASQTAGGGLGGHGEVSMWYDAKRYVVVELDTEWPPPPNFAFLQDTSRPLPLMPNQVIRKISDRTYTTTVARPTPEEAREFACVANRLLVTPRPKPPPPKETPSNPNLPVEVTVTATRPCEVWMSDGAYNNYGVRTSRSGFSYDDDLSCAARDDLESRTRRIIYGPIVETLERRTGTWKPPRVHSLAVDAADNLYMLIDPGTKRKHEVEVREVTPSGDSARLRANAGEPFDVGGLVVDRSGHVLAAANENLGVVMFDVISGTHWSPLEGSAGFVRSFKSTAIDARDNLYAASSFKIYRISPTGQVTQLADFTNQEIAADYLADRYHVAVASDGRLFVSDATLNIIEELTAEGSLTLVAGTPGKVGANDGPAHRARFNAPRGMVVSRDGSLYVADSGSHTIRRIDPAGKVSTLAGKHGKRATVNGFGPSARLDSPDSIAIDSTGVLYVTNGSDNLIRKISPAGAVSTVNAQPFVDLQ